VVAADIWRARGRDRSLRLPDILVVVPEGQKDLYFSQVSKRMIFYSIIT